MGDMYEKNKPSGWNSSSTERQEDIRKLQDPKSKELKLWHKGKKN